MNPLVIKYGGSLLEDSGQQSQLLKEIARAWKAGLPLIVVHGGGKEISRRMQEAGLAPRFVNGRRFTDDAAMAVVEQALAQVNADIVRELGLNDVLARGLSGQTQHLMVAEAQADLGRVGIPRYIDAKVLTSLLQAKGLPVFYSVAEDAAHIPLNINADDFALELAAACRAQDLIFLTETGGILDSDKALLPTLTPADVERLIAEGTINGGMMVKARSCVDALRRGVGQVRIGKMLRMANQGLVLEEGTGFRAN